MIFESPKIGFGGKNLERICMSTWKESTWRRMRDLVDRGNAIQNNVSPISDEDLGVCAKCRGYDDHNKAHDVNKDPDGKVLNVKFFCKYAVKKVDSQTKLSSHELCKHHPKGKLSS